MINATYTQIQAIQQFDAVHSRASLARWWNRLTGHPQNLLSFESIREYLLTTAPRYRGVQEIPVERITGSVGRSRDFDHNFRPLNESLRGRWVQVLSLHEMAGWEPIDVYKVGNLYFVQDGHHRVSVAREMKIPTIEARVYDYPASISFSPQEPLQQIITKLRAVYQPAPAAAVSCGCCDCG